MTPNEYQTEALRTASGMNKDVPMVVNGVLGLCGESGECADMEEYENPTCCLEYVIGVLNFYREKYNETKDKHYWWQMIQLLPSSYNQKRTVTMTYENLLNMLEYRRGHKLDEWRQFCEWIFTLPNSHILREGIGE